MLKKFITTGLVLTTSLCSYHVFAAEAAGEAEKETATEVAPEVTAEAAPEVTSVIAPEASKNEWQFKVTPYLWAASLKGTTGIALPPVLTEIDISQSDIFENLDMTFFLNAQAQKGEWGGSLDMVYMDVSKEKEGEHSSIDLVMKQTLVSGSIFLQPKELPGFELHLGARYADLSNELSIVVTGSEGDGFSGSLGDDWVEAFIGARYSYAVTPKFNLTAYGDFGGFSGESDSMYQVALTANYQMTDLLSISGGYRIIDVDYIGNNFVYDVKTEGVMLGLGFKF